MTKVVTATPVTMGAEKYEEFAMTDKPSAPSLGLLLGESRAMLAYGRYLLRGLGHRQLPAGNGQPVLVLPGFGASDASTRSGHACCVACQGPLLRCKVLTLCQVTAIVWANRAIDDRLVARSGIRAGAKPEGENKWNCCKFFVAAHCRPFRH